MSATIDHKEPSPPPPQTSGNATQASCLGRLWSDITKSTTSKGFFLLYLIALIAVAVTLSQVSLPDASKVAIGLSAAFIPLIVYIVRKDF